MSGKPKIDMTGKKCGRLTVIEGAGSKRGQLRWRCKCDCGNETVAFGYDLRTGHKASCGCLYAERKPRLTHGMTGKPTYNSWCSMRARCNNPRNQDYAGYGGRGITVCDRWNDFEAFLADMGEMPEGYSIERKDVNGNYEPSNCKWIPMAEQALNRRPRRRAA
jgi:hypothetical protein